MKRGGVLLLLAGLAACNRHGVADVTLDAAAAQRNATAAKTLADLQAAADASRGPAPIVRDARPASAPEAVTAAAPIENAMEMPADNGIDETEVAE